jgi:hypothetical protein
MNIFPLIDIQIDRGTTTGDMLQWNDTTKRYENTQNPTAPSSGIFGHWTRATTTLAPAVAGDTLRIDAIGPEDGTDDDLIQLANIAGQVDVNGILTTTGSLLASSTGTHSINRNVNTNGVPTRVLFLERTITPSALAGDGIELRFRMMDDSFTENLGYLSFSTINNLDATPESIFRVTTFNTGIATVGLTLDNSSNLNVIGNARIGDTTAPTERLEVNGNIVQDEANGSRYLLRYSLMGV